MQTKCNNKIIILILAQYCTIKHSFPVSDQESQYRCSLDNWCQDFVDLLDVGDDNYNGHNQDYGSNLTPTINIKGEVMKKMCCQRSSS